MPDNAAPLVTGSPTYNVAFAGLTAAGKTTHAKRLAHELGYEYISATEILLSILGIKAPSDHIWFTKLHEIQASRMTGAVDAELEAQLISMNRTRRKVVFDTWALAWIGDGPLVRIWIESDLDSRVRKCFVSQRAKELSEAQCRALVEEKDEFNHRIFRQRHGFDLFLDRHRYDAVLCNSHLIPTATPAATLHGIETFAPVVRAAVRCVLASDCAGARTLQDARPQEVHRIMRREQ